MEITNKMRIKWLVYTIKYIIISTLYIILYYDIDLNVLNLKMTNVHVYGRKKYVYVRDKNILLIIKISSISRKKKQ